MRYLAIRFLRAGLLLAGVSVLCFVFMQMAPGNFVDEMRLDPQISAETLAGLRAQYALDRPLPIRYAKWLKSALRGDFGFSFAYNLPVSSLLWVRARNTVLLSSTATLLAWLMAVPLGIWTAARHRGWLDRVTTGVTSLLLSVPEIVMAVALLAVAVQLRIAPVGGMMSVSFEQLSPAGKLMDVAAHLCLPTLILVLGMIAVIVRHVRSSVLEVLDAPFIQAARANGVGSGRLLFRHVLPVAANPAISLFGFSVAALLSGSLLVEVITGWPGLGPLVLEATLARDLYVVIGAVMCSSGLMLVGNFMADLLLLWTDPRITTESRNA